MKNNLINLFPIEEVHNYLLELDESGDYLTIIESTEMRIQTHLKFYQRFLDDTKYLAFRISDRELEDDFSNLMYSINEVFLQVLADFDGVEHRNEIYEMIEDALCIVYYENFQMLSKKEDFESLHLINKFAEYLTKDGIYEEA